MQRKSNRASGADVAAAREQQRRTDRARIIAEFYGAPDQARFPQPIIAPVTGYSERWLEHARSAGGGPAFIRVGGTNTTDKRGRSQVFGGRIFYRKSDVLAWLEAQKPVRSTSEYAQRRAGAGGVTT